MKAVRVLFCLLISGIMLGSFSGCGEDDPASGPSYGHYESPDDERNMYLEVPDQIGAGAVNTVNFELSGEELQEVGSFQPRGVICGNGKNCSLVFTQSSSGEPLQFEFKCPYYECGKKYDLEVYWGKYRFKCSATMVECLGAKFPHY